MKAALGAWWRERTDRERVVLAAGVAIILALATYAFVVDPLIERSARLDRRIAQRQTDLAQVSRLGAEYQAVAERIAGLDQRITAPGSFSLLSFLEETASARQMRNRLTSIRPQPTQTLAPYREVTAEVKVESITLAEVVSFLDALDRAPQRVRVKLLRLKTRFADPKLLDGSLLVSTYERAP